MFYRLFIFQLLVLTAAASLTQAGEHAPLLQVGKEWRYDVAYYDGYGSNMVRRHADYRMWVEGDTIISGQRYFLVREDGSSSLHYLWCEVGDKVYRYDEVTGESFIEYDFGLEAGDQALSWGMGTFDVVGTDTLLTFGEPRKRIILHSKEVGANTVWIEGVGNPGLLREPLGHTVSDGKVYTLLSCYENGECVFETRHFCAPCSAWGTPPSRSWHYIDWHVDVQDIEYPDMNSQQTLWKAGEKTVDGRRYDLVRFQKGVSPWYSDSVLVRREGSCVYALAEDLRRIFHPSDEVLSNCYDRIGKEVLIYDFGKEEGEAFGDTKIVEMTETEILGMPRKCLTLANGHRVVEDIGSLTGGYFDYMMNLVWEDEWRGRRRCVLDAYEENGEVVLSKDTMESVLSVASQSPTVPIGAKATHDLQGRRISGTPQHGIYIRDGKKYVVR